LNDWVSLAEAIDRTPWIDIGHAELARRRLHAALEGLVRDDGSPTTKPLRSSRGSCAATRSRSSADASE
jgi:hypothetical protein